MSQDKVIQCPCGYTLQGADDEAVVAAAQEHARAVHDQTLSRDQALAMARPA
jgi:predicted small metal-binding protein